MSEFTEEELKGLLNKDSKTLSTIIIINRTLGCYKAESKFCMIELMKRRSLGEDFKFEIFIKENVESHKVNLNIPNIKEMKHKLVASFIENAIKENLSSPTNEEEDDLY